MWKHRRSSVDPDSALFGREMLEWVDLPHVVNSPKVVLFATDDGMEHSVNLDQYRGGDVMAADGGGGTLVITWVGGEISTYDFKKVDVAKQVLRGLS